MEKKKINCKHLLIILLIFLKPGFNKNEIEIIMNKTLGNEIIYSGKVNNIDSYYLKHISEVIINGIPSSMNDYTDLLNDGLNDIIIKFNDKLTTCEKIFYKLDNILYIDFSNFFSSNVKNMNYMFGYCTSIVSLNVNNFNTSFVTDMSGIFSH